MSVVAQLREELGDVVDTAPDSLESARADASGHRSAGRPLAVVHVRTVDDVQRTLRFASRTATPVVVRGAGTGLAGAANAGPGEIVLSTAGMDRILEVRAADGAVLDIPTRVGNYQVLLEHLQNMVRLYGDRPAR